MYLRERRGELLFDELSLLHFSPEPPFERLFRSLPNLRYASADLDAPGAMHHFDIQDIPLDDDTFDAILCSHVLEHVPDDRRAMRELRRVLKPGGWALVLVPIDSSRAETHEDPSITSRADRRREYWQEDHVRLYGRDFARRLEEEGFAVTVERYMREVEPDIAARHGLPADDMYVCSSAPAARGED